MAGPVLTAIYEFARLPIPGGVCELDGTIVDANDAAEILFGRSRADMVGRKAWDVAPGADLIWDEVLAAARERGTHRGEIAIATPQEPRQIYYVASVREHEGKSRVLIFALELQGNRIVSDENLESKHRLEALGLVAGGIAHDFNNQLVSVLAEASAAREDQGLTESGHEALRRIEAAAHRMAQLTRQLLAYAGRGRFVTEIIDPDELVRQTQDALVRAVIPQARLAIVPGAGRVAIEADRGLLRQVIVNLVANASDALGDGGGSVRVATRVDGDTWLLEVSDSGLGMDQRTIARIFDPFFTTKPDQLTGYQLVPLARALQPSATVMLMSGYTDQRRGAGGEDEPDVFLEKPFTARVLDRVMDDVLARLR